MGLLVEPAKQPRTRPGVAIYGVVWWRTIRIRGPGWMRSRGLDCIGHRGSNRPRPGRPNGSGRRGESRTPQIGSPARKGCLQYACCQGGTVVHGGCGGDRGGSCGLVLWRGLVGWTYRGRRMHLGVVGLRTRSVPTSQARGSCRLGTVGSLQAKVGSQQGQSAEAFDGGGLLATIMCGGGDRVLQGPPVFSSWSHAHGWWSWMKRLDRTGHSTTGFGPKLATGFLWIERSWTTLVRAASQVPSPGSAPMRTLAVFVGLLMIAPGVLADPGEPEPDPEPAQERCTSVGIIGPSVSVPPVGVVFYEDCRPSWWIEPLPWPPI